MKMCARRTPSGAAISITGTVSPAQSTNNVFIERLWRSCKYECVYLNAFETGSEARKGLGEWIEFYNARRPHSTFDGQTPDEAYKEKRVKKKKELPGESKEKLTVSSAEEQQKLAA